MPPKRKAADDESGTAKKAKPAAPRLKKSQQPEWDLSSKKPEGEWARKSIERWSLLPPYKGHSEQSWKNYYEQRAALDEVNTPDNVASKPIVSEELGQDTWQLLRKASNNVACAIYGATLVDEERKLAIARTLRGSLYYCDLWGNDEEGGGDNPRTVNAKTRLYSPFGIGTAIDFAYDYHYRMRMTMGAERFSTLVAQVRHMDEMEPSNPRGCIAVRKDKRGLEKPEEGAVKLHNMKGATISGTAAKNFIEFEETLFGCSGWLSPRKVYDLLASAGTVGHYHEALGRDILEKAGRGKFKMFQGETDGRSDGKDEATKLTGAEQLANDADSLPLRLLSLAKGLGSGQDGEQDPSEDGASIAGEQEDTSGDAVEEPTATNSDNSAHAEPSVRIGITAPAAKTGASVADECLLGAGTSSAGPKESKDGTAVGAFADAPTANDGAATTTSVGPNASEPI